MQPLHESVAGFAWGMPHGKPDHRWITAFLLYRIVVTASAFHTATHTASVYRNGSRCAPVVLLVRLEFSACWGAMSAPGLELEPAPPLSLFDALAAGNREFLLLGGKLNSSESELLNRCITFSVVLLLHVPAVGFMLFALLSACTSASLIPVVASGSCRSLVPPRHACPSAMSWALSRPHACMAKSRPCM